MKDVIEPKPLLISIAKCLVADVTSPIVSFIPIPRDFLASITAKAVRITKKLLAKTSTSVIRAMMKVMILIGSHPKIQQSSPEQPQNSDASTAPAVTAPLPDAAFNYSNPDVFNCLPNEIPISTTTGGGG